MTMRGLLLCSGVACGRKRFYIRYANIMGQHPTAITANRVVGQVNLADSTSNEWFITGVQMELGKKATCV